MSSPVCLIFPIFSPFLVSFYFCIFSLRLTSFLFRLLHYEYIFFGSRYLFYWCLIFVLKVSFCLLVVAFIASSCDSSHSYNHFHISIVFFLIIFHVIFQIPISISVLILCTRLYIILLLIYILSYFCMDIYIYVYSTDFSTQSDMPSNLLPHLNTKIWLTMTIWLGKYRTFLLQKVNICIDTFMDPLQPHHKLFNKKLKMKARRMTVHEIRNLKCMTLRRDMKIY